MPIVPKYERKVSPQVTSREQPSPAMAVTPFRKNPELAGLQAKEGALLVGEQLRFMQAQGQALGQAAGISQKNSLITARALDALSRNASSFAHGLGVQKLHEANAKSGVELAREIKAIQEKGDLENLSRDFAEAAGRIYDKYSEGLSFGFKDRFELSFETTKTQSLLGLQEWGRKRLAERAEALTEQEEEQLQAKWLGAGPAQKTVLLEDFSLRLKERVTNGLMPENKAETTLQKVKANLAALTVNESIINATNHPQPTKILKSLRKKIDNREVLGLNEYTRQNALARIDQALKAARVKEKGAFASNVYAHVSGMGPAEAQEWLTNPKKYGNFFKVMGVPKEDWLSVISMARTQVTARQVAVKTQQAEAQQKTDRAAIKEINGLLNAASSGKGLSGAVARLRELAPELSHSTYSALSKDLNDRIKDFQAADKARIDYKHSLSYNKVLSSVLGGKHDWTIDQMLDAGVAVDQVDALLNKQAEQSRTGYPNQINKAESVFKAMFKNDEDMRLKLPAFRAELLAFVELNNLHPTDPKIGEAAQVFMTKVEISRNGLSDYEGPLAYIQSDKDLPGFDPDVIRQTHFYLAYEEREPQVEADDAMVDKKRAVALVIKDLKKNETKISLKNIKAVLQGNPNRLAKALSNADMWNPESTEPLPPSWAE